jgi:hypothetical protein
MSKLSIFYYVPTKNGFYLNQITILDGLFPFLQVQNQDLIL